MAPPKTKFSGKDIEQALKNEVRRIYHSDERELLSVNYARQKAEERLGLEEGFLKHEDWKAKSKEIIKDTLKYLEDEEAEPPQRVAPTPEKPKAAPKDGGREKMKKRTKASTPSDKESDISGIEESPDRPSKKRKTTKPAKRRNKVVSDDEDGEAASPSVSELSDALKDSAGRKAQSSKETSSKSAANDNDDESELSSVVDEPPKRNAKSKSKAKPSPSPAPAPADEPTNADSSSELSSVIDDGPPPPQRKRGKSKEAAVASGPTKTSKSKSKSATPTSSSALSAEEAQIKLLQSQLAKCGVRKVWAFEFKKQGDDTPQAKIRRLKQHLRDVGMTGRFSEARAREIREARELAAEMEEVMQGEKSWGVRGSGSGAGAGDRQGRRRRAAAAAAASGRARVVDEDGGDEEGSVGGDRGSESGSEDEEGGRKAAVRKRAPAKRRADLAFLDDESESE
ncbi:hypothetical protein VTK26DRAFT_3372 [Humicola hyalothermophila]